jgi:hypothetical protein
MENVTYGIKLPEADERASELAPTTGQSITAAVVRALREQSKRQTGRAAVQQRDVLRAELASR